MGGCCFKKIQEDDEDPNLSESRVIIADAQEAHHHKQKGNQHFKKKAYQNAIKSYQQAINKNPKEIVYYTNLALAYRANGQFLQAIKTIDQMQKQNLNPCPNFLDLTAKGKVLKARCINSLAKKYIIKNSYSPNQTSQWLQEINLAIKILKQAKQEFKSQAEVNQYLNHSLKIKNYLNRIQQNTSESHFVDYLKTKIKKSQNGLHKQKGWQKIKDYVSNQDVLLKQVESLYSKLHLKFLQQAEENQEYLFDPITYQKYKEPVIVPSGISYEEQTLRQYFKKGQEYKDPITKEKFPIGQKIIVKNYALKNYISELGKVDQVRKEDIQLLIC